MRTIFNTTYGKATSLEGNAKRALPFLIKNASRIELNEQGKSNLKTMRSLVDTPIVELYDRMLKEDALNQFLTLNLSGINDEIPVVLSFDEISVDGYHFTNAPDRIRKSWVNITPVLAKRAANARGLLITDIPRLMGYYVRGMFCMGYSDKDMWLGSSLSPFVIRSYSMAVKMRVAQAFNLDIDESALVETAFAYHYAKLLGPENDNSPLPVLLNRCGFLGSYAEIGRRIEHLTTAVDGDLHADGLISICDALAKTGPVRMQKFSANDFYHLFAIGNLDNMSLALAIDYPPYWVYLLIKYASGGKNMLLGNLFRQGFMKRELKPFVDALLKHRDLIIKR